MYGLPITLLTVPIYVESRGAEQGRPSFTAAVAGSLCDQFLRPGAFCLSVLCTNVAHRVSDTIVCIASVTQETAPAATPGRIFCSSAIASMP